MVGFNSFSTGIILSLIFCFPLCIVTMLGSYLPLVFGSLKMLSLSLCTGRLTSSSVESVLHGGMLFGGGGGSSTLILP